MNMRNKNNLFNVHWSMNTIRSQAKITEIAVCFFFMLATYSHGSVCSVSWQCLWVHMFYCDFSLLR